MSLYFMLLQVSEFSFKGFRTLHKQKFLTNIHKNQAMQTTNVNRQQDSSYTFVW